MILVINGPNLNMLGFRNPGIYGSESLDDTLSKLTAQFPETDFEFFQSNHEGEIIDRIHQAILAPESPAGLIINPGALAHYSHALADALEMATFPVVEVHISNILARDEFRHVSVTARASDAVITGCGRTGYSLAARYILSL